MLESGSRVRLTRGHDVQGRSCILSWVKLLHYYDLGYRSGRTRKATRLIFVRGEGHGWHSSPLEMNSNPEVGVGCGELPGGFRRSWTPRETRGPWSHLHTVRISQPSPALAGELVPVRICIEWNIPKSPSSCPTHSIILIKQPTVIILACYLVHSINKHSKAYVFDTPKYISAWALQVSGSVYGFFPSNVHLIVYITRPATQGTNWTFNLCICKISKRYCHLHEEYNPRIFKSYYQRDVDGDIEKSPCRLVRDVWISETQHLKRT